MCLNERNVNLIPIWAVIQSMTCKNFAAKRHLAPALMHFDNTSWSDLVWWWRYVVFIYGVIRERLCYKCVVRVQHIFIDHFLITAK